LQRSLRAQGGEDGGPIRRFSGGIFQIVSCANHACSDAAGGPRAHYHVTQVVEGTKGIHGMIPKAIFVGR
jgi:hypothetical protein